MFAYSFLAMTAYNVVKPLTRSKFIESLGADNLPYVLLVSGLIIGVLMPAIHVADARGCRGAGGCRSRRRAWRHAVVFWFLFQTKASWVSVAFYVLGRPGVLLISQFWTLANVVYDPRQAKRLFGFIGGGAPLGGIAGAATRRPIRQSDRHGQPAARAAVLMGVCAVLVSLIMRRERSSRPDAASGRRERAEPREAFGCCSSSRGTCRSSRSSSASPPSARRSSSSSSTWRPAQGTRRDRLDHGVPRQGRAWIVDPVS